MKLFKVSVFPVFVYVFLVCSLVMFYIQGFLEVFFFFSVFGLLKQNQGCEQRA